MKKCTRCGALQDDSHIMCVDCTALLPSPMSEEEMLEQNISLSDSLVSMTDKMDDFYISKKRKIVIILDILGIALCIFLAATQFYGTETAGLCLYIAVFFAIAAAVKGLPRLFWKMEKFRLSFVINEAYMTSPTDRWIMGNTITGYALSVIGYLLLFYIYTLK